MQLVPLSCFVVSECGQPQGERIVRAHQVFIEGTYLCVLIMWLSCVGTRRTQLHNE